MELLPLLAQDNDNAGKIIYFVVFVALWVGSAIASKVGKQKAEQKKREQRLRDMLEAGRDRAREQAEPAPPMMPPPVQQQPASHRAESRPHAWEPRQKIERAPQTVTIPPLPPQLPPRPKQKQQKQRKRPPTMQQVQQVQQIAPPAAPSAPPAAAEETFTMASVARPAISARTLHRILKPKDLQSAYILTELLNKPISLRTKEISDRAL